MIDEFLQRCNSCGKCQKVCPFLSLYGNPSEVLKKDDDTVFECTNCGACSIVCPFKLAPSDALHKKKQIRILTKNVSERVTNVINLSRAFALRGHRFPFKHYSDCEVAFWPGCGLAGVGPQIVKASLRTLSKRLNKPIGLILDCCFDPCYQMGDIESAQSAISQIHENLKRCGVKELITGCGNCTKLLSKYLKDITVKHIFEVLEGDDLPQLPRDFSLHHPCPSFRLHAVWEKVKKLILNPDTLKSNNLPNCCGLGGGLHHLNPELSNAFTQRALMLCSNMQTEESSKNSTILTYCMGCKAKFIKQDVKIYHVLEGLKGAKRLEDVPSPLKKHFNRISLAVSSKINLKKIALLFALLSVIFLTTKLRADGHISVDQILRFIEANKVLAPALFIGFYTIAPSVFIPSLALTLGAGFIWGPFWGTVFAITGATLGATVPFLLSRYIMGDWVKRRFSEEGWVKLNAKVSQHGWKAVAFTRIVPIFPYPVLNYLFGITPIPLLHYVWATFVFMLPACVTYTAFGSSMGELILKGNITGLIIGIVIASIAMLIPLALKRFVKKLADERS